MPFPVPAVANEVIYFQGRILSGTPFGVETKARWRGILLYLLRFWDI